MLLFGAVVWFLGMIGFWTLGLFNFVGIARRAKIEWRGPSSALRIYRFAFTEMRGSSETRGMVIGFLGMLVWALGVGMLLSSLDPAP